MKNNMTILRTAMKLMMVLATCVLSVIDVSAEETFAQKVNMVQLSMTNGLPHNYIDDIYKDSKGFVWISTNGGGLSRYDGYGFKTYDISTRTSISSNFVHQVVEDKNGRLWIASDGGVDIFDLREQVVLNDEICSEEVREMMTGAVLFVNVDKNGTVWFAKENMIYACMTSPETGMVSIETYKCKEPVTAFERISGDVWYAEGMGVYRLGCNGRHVSAEKLDVAFDLGLTKKFMITSFFRKDNDMWIGTDVGLVRVNPVSRTLKLYACDPKNDKSLSQNRITDIAEIGTHDIVASTLKGLNIYNSISDDFEHVTQETHIGQQHLSCNFINCLMVDGDMTWVGTEIGGVDILIPNELIIKNYAHNGNATSIAPNPVNAIKEDSEGNIWVGTVEGGLSVKRPGTDIFDHITTDNGLVHNSISAMDIDDENHLWAGTWGNGVCVIDLNKSNHPVIRRIDELAGTFVGTIVADSQNKGVWVATTDTIYFINSKGVRKPIQDKRVNNMGGSIGGAIDDNGNLWLGTEGGLVIIDLSTMVLDNVSYEILDYRLDDPTDRTKPRVSFIYKAKDGTMFVGTNGYGLCYRRPDEDKFGIITTNEGLSNNSIRGVVEDKQGNVWVSTYRGLSYVDLDNEKVTTYSTADGLMDDNFYWNSALVSPSTGSLFFGTLSGLIEVRRRSVPLSEVSLEGPTITALRVLNTDVESSCSYIKTGVSYADELTIHERDKSFTVEFSALNYRTPKSVVYSYKLSGFDAHWTEVSSDRRLATYTNLPAGDYELQIRSTDGHGNWSEMTRLKIEVAPFFYKTIWFYMLMLLIVSIVIWQVFHFRMRNLKEQRRLLNLLVKERTEELEMQKETLESQKQILEENTRELEEKSEELEMQKETLEMQKKILEDNTRELEEKSEELEQQNNILADQNMQITRQKDSIEQMAAKIKKMSFDKLQFFTNISHEIRTPITLILGPTRRALSMTDDAKMIEQLKLVEKSSVNLLEIVNQLMDFRKIETNNMELKVESGKIVTFVKDIVHPFAVYASERNIRVESIFRMRTDIIMYDSDAVNKVVSNLLSNAIKYTNDSGKVTLYMATILKDGKDMIYMSVSDTGEGIPEEELERIFDSYYQSDNHKKAYVYGQTGTGIGLYLCRKLVTLAGGNIWAKNNRGKGCSMRMLVPYQEGVVMSENRDMESDVYESEEAEIIDEEEKKHILVVEDNKDMRTYIRTILEDTYEVYEAQNGVEGLTVLAENDIDFIICDLMMPVMDGLEFAKKVKSNFSFSHIHILILTAQMADKYRTESYRIGVESYLHKPFDEQMLLARVNGILASRKENQQKFQYSLNMDDLNIDRESEDEKFVKEVLKLVEQNYKDSEYSIDDILKSMCCSKSMLNKKMQNVIGQSPGMFIRSYRLNMAKQLILLNRKTKNMNISQIAYDVGFNDPKYFTRCFTKHFCVTPSALMEGTENENAEEGETDVK